MCRRISVDKWTGRQKEVFKIVYLIAAVKAVSGLYVQTDDALFAEIERVAFSSFVRTYSLFIITSSFLWVASFWSLECCWIVNDSVFWRLLESCTVSCANHLLPAATQSPCFQITYFIQILKKCLWKYLCRDFFLHQAFYNLLLSVCAYFLAEWGLRNIFFKSSCCTTDN